MRLSVVVPVHNEVDTAQALVERMRAVPLDAIAAVQSRRIRGRHANSRLRKGRASRPNSTGSHVCDKQGLAPCPRKPTGDRYGSSDGRR